MPDTERKMLAMSSLVTLVRKLADAAYQQAVAKESDDGKSLGQPTSEWAKQVDQLQSELEKQIQYLELEISMSREIVESARDIANNWFRYDWKMDQRIRRLKASIQRYDKLLGLPTK